MKRCIFFLVSIIILAFPVTAQIEFNDSSDIQFRTGLDMNSNTISGLPSPSSPGDAVPKSYADSLSGGGGSQGLPSVLEFNSTANQTIYMDTNQIVGLPDATASSEPITLGQIGEDVVNRSGDTMTGNLDMDGNDIVNVGYLNGEGDINLTGSSDPILNYKAYENPGYGVFLRYNSNYSGDTNDNRLVLGTEDSGNEYMVFSADRDGDWIDLERPFHDSIDIRRPASGDPVLNYRLQQGNDYGAHVRYDSNYSGDDTDNRLVIGTEDSGNDYEVLSAERAGSWVKIHRDTNISGDLYVDGSISGVSASGLSEVLEVNNTANQSIVMIEGVVIGDSSTSAGSEDGVALGPGANTVVSGSDSNGSIAIGLDSYAESNSGSGNSATALGRNAYAYGYGSTALGKGANASANSAVALGRMTEALSAGTAVGDLAYANGDAVALGNGANGGGTDSVALGLDADAAAYDTIAIGQGATANNIHSTAIQENAVTNGNDAIAIGRQSAGNSGNAVAVGRSSLAGGSGGAQVALGYNSNASGDASTALGFGTAADGNGAVSVGRSASSTGSGVAIGRDAVENEGNGVAVGYNANAASWNTVAIGTGADSWDSAVAIGKQSSGWDYRAIAIGDSSNVTGIASTAIGYDSTVSESSSVALGESSSVTAANSVAMGYNTATSGASSVVIGDSAQNSGDSNNIIAIGRDSIAGGPGGSQIALGYDSEASGRGSMAIGFNSSSSSSEGLALGTRSSAEGNVDSIAIGRNTTSVNGSIAIGGITVPSYAPNTSLETEALGEVSIALAPGAQATADNAYALGIGSESSGVASSAIGLMSNASADRALAIGSEAEATAYNAVAIGEQALAPNSNEATFGNLNGDEMDVNVTGNLETHGTVTADQAELRQPQSGQPVLSYRMQEGDDYGAYLEYDSQFGGDTGDNRLVIGTEDSGSDITALSLERSGGQAYIHRNMNLSGNDINNVGTLNANTKNFVQDVNGTHEIVYTSSESGEVVVEWSDSVNVSTEGIEVKLPYYLREVMSTEEDYHVITTSVNSLANTGVFNKTDSGFTLKASEDTEVDFHVRGVREGFEDKEILREK